MNAKHAALARKHLDRRLAPLRAIDTVSPPKGWIKAIRESLGMTVGQLAARLGVVPSRVVAIEQAEVIGSTTLRTLRETAAAMDCALVYAFVPIKPLDDMLRDRALQKAREDVARLDHTMRLENQALHKADLDAEQQRAIDRLLSGSLRGLWDDRGDRHS